MTMLDPPHPKEASVAPRPPQTVMRLARMGAAHPFRLSFLRVMLRRMAAEGFILLFCPYALVTLTGRRADWVCRRAGVLAFTGRS